MQRGDDGRDGRTPETAWRTLARVNGLGSGAAGEVVGLARGGLWREALYVPAPRMTFVPYGAGAKPIICGAELKVRWIEDQPFDSVRPQSRSFRTYSVRQDDDPGEQVFVDDMRLSPAACAPRHGRGQLLVGRGRPAAARSLRRRRRTRPDSGSKSRRRRSAARSPGLPM